MWLIIVLFVFQSLNRKRSYTRSRHIRRRTYVTSRYAQYSALYDASISTANITGNLRLLMYAIMIIESFNRPQLVRRLENIIKRRNGTYGIMQIRSATPLRDGSSVVAAANLIAKLNHDIRTASDPQRPTRLDDRSYEITVLERIVAIYNPSSSYIADVMGVYGMIFIEDQSLNGGGDVEEPLAEAGSSPPEYNVFIPLEGKTAASF